jgi:hypothetical protein
MSSELNHICSDKYLSPTLIPVSNEINKEIRSSDIPNLTSENLEPNFFTAKTSERNSIKLNLIRKFNKVKPIIDTTGLTYNEILNEMQNKVNIRRQVINFKEQLNQIYSNEVKNFVDHFLNYFNEISELVQKEHFDLSESLQILQEKLLLSSNNPEEINEIEKEICVLEEKIKNNKSNNQISNLLEKLNRLKAFNINNHLIFKEGRILPTSSQKEKSELIIRNIRELSHKKMKNIHDDSNALLDTIYLKKSKTRYGEDDDIQPLETSQNKIESFKQKSKKLFLRNFMQIFLIKDKGIFSESFFSKIDKSLLNSYKKFKFYEIKFYFSIEESYKDITDYINKLRRLFPRYLMLFKEIHKKRFVKITICGVGKKQSVMKRLLINIMSGDVDKDCLFKISLFSNVFDALAESIRKIEKNRNYFYSTNFKNSTLNKIITKVYSLSN